MRFNEIISESSSRAIQMKSDLNDNIVVYSENGETQIPIDVLVRALHNLHFDADEDTVIDELEGNKLVDHIDKDQGIVYLVSDEVEQQKDQQEVAADQEAANAAHVEKMAASAAKSPLRNPLS